MRIGRRLVGIVLVLALARPVLAAEEEPWEEVFDPEPWAAEALASLPEVSAAVGAAVLVEAETGTCLYEHEAHARLAPASVTKIMTLLLCCEALDAGALTEDTPITASAAAAGMGGSQIYLKEGETMPLRDLMKSVAVSSANDAAVALAEAIAGSEGAFVAQMNRRAAELGMADTVFSNCTGLPTEGEHLTSAWDIALMSRALLSHERIRPYCTIWTDTVRDGAFGLSSTNKLVRFYSGCTGLKTGFTQAAGYCLSASACRDDTEYIAVVLHCETSAIRFEAARLLLDHAFANYRAVELLPESALPPVAVELGTREFVQPVPAETPRLLLERSAAAGLQRQVELLEQVDAPVAAGQELGQLVVTDGNGTELGRVALVAEEGVPRLSLWQTLLRLLRHLVC